MGNFETIIFEKKEGIGYVTLNRPRVLNAYNLRMRDEIYQVLGAVRDDPEVMAVIFSGAGEKAFSVGADITEFLTAPSPVIARQARWERDVWGLFLSIPKPLIAALHGYVLGSGLEMALCCDLRIAAENARLGLPEITLGMIPPAGGTQNLPRTIGRAKALEMLLSGQWIDAREAYRIGLVNQVVAPQDLLPAAEGMARKIMSRSALAVRYAKEAVNRGLELSLEEGLELERKLAAALLATGEEMK
ncbi:MAG: enoyl-CoA hydratase/isomerase family protein [Dehalococcoidia bacterium]